MINLARKALNLVHMLLSLVLGLPFLSVVVADPPENDPSGHFGVEDSDRNPIQYAPGHPKTGSPVRFDTLFECKVFAEMLLGNRLHEEVHVVEYFGNTPWWVDTVSREDGEYAWEGESPEIDRYVDPAHLANCYNALMFMGNVPKTPYKELGGALSHLWSLYEMSMSLDDDEIVRDTIRSAAGGYGALEVIRAIVDRQKQAFHSLALESLTNQCAAIEGGTPEEGREHWESTRDYTLRQMKEFGISYESRVEIIREALDNTGLGLEEVDAQSMLQEQDGDDS